MSLQALAPRSIDTVLTEWQTAQQQLAQVKSRELTLRLEATAMLFPSPCVGVNTYELGQGWKAKMTHKINYTLQKENVTVVRQLIGQIGNVGSFLADKLLPIKYEISETAYRDLDLTLPTELQARQLLDSILTSKPGTPSFEICGPKGS